MEKNGNVVLLNKTTGQHMKFSAVPFFDKAVFKGVPLGCPKDTR
jgi:hypothetical protein